MVDRAGALAARRPLQNLTRATMALIRKKAGTTVESIAAFYEQTEGGRFLLAKGRLEGREEGREEEREALLADLLRERFGDDPRIPDIARRLSAIGDRAAVRAVLAARGLDDL